MPALFLDRDGVILQVRRGAYNNTLGDCTFIPGVLGAFSVLVRYFYPIVVITNQAGSAYGYTTNENIDAIHKWIQDAVEGDGGRIDEIYYCHHSVEDKCRCRKPGTALFEKARDRFGMISLEDSYMVGDSVSDVLAAVAVGATPVLVRTGLGAQLLHEVIEDPKNYGMLMDANPLVVDDLLAFAYWIKVKPLTEYAKKATAPSHTTA
jgi:D-glycero-D-manno-heptose 1,7-bisphosphate phosphatase